MSLTDSTALVTRDAEYIDSHLVDLFLEEDCNVIADDFSRGEIGYINHAIKI